MLAPGGEAPWLPLGRLPPGPQDILLLGGRVRGSADPEDASRSSPAPRDVRRFDEAGRRVATPRARALPKGQAERRRVLHAIVRAVRAVDSRRGASRLGRRS